MKTAAMVAAGRLILTVVLVVGCDPLTPGQSLREEADRVGILVGSAVRPEQLSEGAYALTLSREFNMVEAEDAMKWWVVRPDRATFDFRQADRIVEFAQAHGMKVRGHTLVWGRSNPSWINEYNRAPRALHALLQDHIRRVVGHFRGKVFAWDVVNEAFDERGKLRSTVWYDQPGIGFAGQSTKYIEQAFWWAHEAHPEALLFYNDAEGEAVNAKSDAIYTMVKDFRGRGVPIDGVGLQMHVFDLNPDLAGIEANIARFTALGVQVHVTEMDVALPTNADGTTRDPRDLERQAEIYGAIAGICLRHPGCTAIQTWGFTDKYSWMHSTTKGAKGAALVFDRDYRPKAAYGTTIGVVRACPWSPAKRCQITKIAHFHGYNGVSGSAVARRSASPRTLPKADTTSEKQGSRRKIIIPLAIGIAVLFGILLSQSSFDQPAFLNPDNNQQLLVFAALSALIFLSFVALTFVLFRNLLKLFAERRLGVLGSKFRTRLVVAGLLLSFLPVIVMFWFAYGLMNRTIVLWFSRPVQEVREDTRAMASLLATYAQQNAVAEAASIAGSPEVQRAFASGNFSSVESEFELHQATLQGGFVIALLGGSEKASFREPAPWTALRAKAAPEQLSGPSPAPFMWGSTEYILGTSAVGNDGLVLVAMPLPEKFSAAVKQLESSQNRYFDLYRQRRLLRRTYMSLLLLLTVLVLFSTTWLALFLSKLVTRPVAALAEATQEISRGRLDYRVEVNAADEIGDLVRSFNRMAEELESSRHQIDESSRELSVANTALEQRRRHIETILESIPTGVLSLDANRRITHANQALLRMFDPGASAPRGSSTMIGADLGEVFPEDVVNDLVVLLRRADRMGITTSQLEITVPRVRLNAALTVATLEHEEERLGYVLIFEDLSDLLKAQKQAAWREVARRVAHEIKNPLTPIALSADRIRRHLERGVPPDRASLEIIRQCSDTIAASVETVRMLVDEFSTLARFPASRPRPANINRIVDSALDLFAGRLDGILLEKRLTPDLPEVMADGDAIRRAVANLVDNAAEAMEGAMVREIRVSTNLVTSRDAVEIVVADTGNGVTQELKEKLFLPYFSTKKRGTGLGLSIVSRIVEDHHGSIRVEENRPVGAKFIVELPLATDAARIPSPQHA